jgi:hypothetical protein
MKTLLSGIAGAIVLAVVAAVALSMIQDPVYQVYSSSSTRLDEPGSNLVGPAWRDNVRKPEPASGGAESAESRTGTGGTTY